MERLRGRQTSNPTSPNSIKAYLGNLSNHHFSLESDRIDDIKQVSKAENDILTAPFSEEEVKVAIFQMEHNKAQGQDGFPVEFYKKF
jgi:hypothetical protein